VFWPLSCCYEGVEIEAESILMPKDLTQNIFDVAALDPQFFAILLGAFLASAGGFFVTWLLDRMERKRQERSIALVCLDLMASLSVMTSLANGARGRGDPYGPFTMRLVRGCVRDVDVYERNRERIADISDPSIRAEIYQCMTRMTLALDGILSETDLIVKLDETLAEPHGLNETKFEELTKQRAERIWRRDGSFDFMMDTVRELGEPLAAKLRAIAKSSPQSLAEIVARTSAPAASATQAFPGTTSQAEAKPQATPTDA
jgi:hypothetical protein